MDAQCSSGSRWGDWVDFRKLDGLIEVDFHWAGEEPSGAYWEHMQQVRDVIATSNAMLASLIEKREVIFKIVDEATCPTQHVPRLPSSPRRMGPGFAYKGTYVPTWTGIDLYIGVLRRLWDEYPERRGDMQRAMRALGRTRSYVATQPDLLFAQKTKQWAAKYSVRLCEGWYADTNLNPRSMRRLLPIAIHASGLVPARDVVTMWTATSSPQAA